MARPRPAMAARSAKGRGCAHGRRRVGGSMGLIREELLGAGTSRATHDRPAWRDENLFRARRVLEGARRAWFERRCSSIPPQGLPGHLGIGPALGAGMLHRRWISPLSTASERRRHRACRACVFSHPRRMPGKIRKIKSLQRNRGKQHYRGQKRPERSLGEPGPSPRCSPWKPGPSGSLRPPGSRHGGPEAARACGSARAPDGGANRPAGDC